MCGERVKSSHGTECSIWIRRLIFVLIQKQTRQDTFNVLSSLTFMLDQLGLLFQCLIYIYKKFKVRARRALIKHFPPFLKINVHVLDFSKENKDLDNILKPSH